MSNLREQLRRVRVNVVCGSLTHLDPRNKISKRNVLRSSRPFVARNHICKRLRRMLRIWVESCSTYGFFVAIGLFRFVMGAEIRLIQIHNAPSLQFHIELVIIVSQCWSEY